MVMVVYLLHRPSSIVHGQGEPQNRRRFEGGEQARLPVRRDSAHPDLTERVGTKAFVAEVLKGVES